MPTITGNVGGTSGSGARVHCRNKNGSFSALATCDSSGDYTFTVADKDTYILSVSLSGFVIRNRAEVVVNNNSPSAVNFTISGINQAS